MKLKDMRHVMNATMAADQAEEDARIHTVFGSLAKSLLTRLGVSRRAKVSFSVEVEFDDVSTSPQGAEVAPTVADQAEPKKPAMRKETAHEADQ